jgi:hypothetical protein
LSPSSRESIAAVSGIAADGSGRSGSSLVVVSEPILATDAERDVAMALLREASVDGRLTLEDLADRAEMVHVARTRDELTEATAGLERAPRSRFSAVLGSITLDLREAVLPGPQVEIEVRSILGSVTVLVPDGVEVQLSGGGALSSEDLRVRGRPPAGAPLIRIRHSGLMGSISVRSPRRLR